MNREQLLKSVEETYEQALKIMGSKNEDYAKESDPFKNFRYSELVGVSLEKAILVRVVDKIARIDNIIDKGETKVKDESVGDTIQDICNYLAILKAYLEKGSNGK